MKETLRDLRRLAEEQNVNDVPPPALGVPRDLLPGERPPAARRRGGPPLLARRSLQPPRPLDGRAVPRVGRPLQGLPRRLRGAATATRAERVVHESLRWAVVAHGAEPAVGGRRRMSTAVAGASPSALREALGADAVKDGDSERDLHSADLSFHEPHRPDLVVYPALDRRRWRACSRSRTSTRIPVTPFGVGTSLEGHVIPMHGGISLDLSRLDRILEISPGNLTATVQAGVTRLALDARRGRARPLLPRRPGRRRDARRHGRDERGRHDDGPLRQDARERARARGGARRRTRDPHRHAAPRRRPPGTTSPGLLVGSEGTLAVITEVTVRLHAIPEQAVALRISFPDIESACRTAAVDRRRRLRRDADRVHGRLVDGRRQRLLRHVVSRRGRACSSRRRAARSSSSPTSSSSRRSPTGRARPRSSHERDPDARARLWKTRHDAAHAAAAHFPGTKERATDVCVPLTELAGAAHFARAEIDRLGLNAGILGHAGDGNLHVAVQVDARRRSTRRRSSSTTSSTTRSHAAARAPASTASASARSAPSCRSTAT